MTATAKLSPAPKKWTDWGSRERLLLAMPERVWKLANCEIAQRAQRHWVAKQPNDPRPQAAIDARVKWCLTPSQEIEDECQRAAWAAGAAEYAASYRLVYLPARPVRWSPDWSTTTVVTLAQLIYAGDYSIFPILADALQDAGCDNDKMLRHLRTQECNRANVAVWTPLGLGVNP